MSSGIERVRESLARRHTAERRFRALGLGALLFAGLMLCLLLVTILGPGLKGFTRHELKLELDTKPWATMLRSDPRGVDYRAMLRGPLADSVEGGFGTVAVRHAALGLLGFFAADEAKRQILRQPEHWGGVQTVWVPLADPADRWLKGSTTPLNDRQIAMLKHWQQEGRIRSRLNRDFFTRGDSRAPEAAGFLGAIIGSLMVLAVCMALALPVAVMTAIALEEFARKTRFAAIIEVTINNLAAVPSIIYGLLGLTVFIHTLGLPRSSALVGGLTLSLLILPVMIIAARASLRAVPPSMRQAAAGLGATKLQVVRHHVLPYALPGIMTGAILSVCRALGETAPLLMIGMVAFVADLPHGALDGATAMPVEIYLWASSPEQGFVARTSTGILVLLVILLLLNATAVTIRNRQQKVWS